MSDETREQFEKWMNSQYLYGWTDTLPKHDIQSRWETWQAAYDASVVSQQSEGAAPTDTDIENFMEPFITSGAYCESHAARTRAESRLNLRAALKSFRDKFISPLEKLIEKIRQTVNVQKSVCHGDITDPKDIPYAIRDLQNCYADAARARNGMYTNLERTLAAREAEIERLRDTLIAADRRIPGLLHSLAAEALSSRPEGEKK